MSLLSRAAVATTSLPLLAAVLGCASAAPPPAAPPTTPAAAMTPAASTTPTAPAVHSPYAAYVLLAESPSHAPVAFARVIVDSGEACPQIVGGDAPIAMTKRDNPHGFSVDVCEAVVPFERALTVGVDGPPLPVAHRRVRHVTVVGDTGCKPEEQRGCGLDDPDWPLPAFARAAAARHPDLVLHMGDFNYRGTPSGFKETVDGKAVQRWYYDAGDGAPPSERCGVRGPYLSQNRSGSPEPDNWKAWWLDFFEPAAPLLAAAPWVVTRGNHELCSHAGPGWFYFLDASSNLPEGGANQHGCPPQDGAALALPHLAFVPPQVVALDGLTVAVVDSANACDQLPNFPDAYRVQLGNVAARIADRPAWFVSHRPVWGVMDPAQGPPYGCNSLPETADEGSPAPYAVLDRTLECAFASDAGSQLLRKVDFLLSGHLHRFERLDFPADSHRPPQIIVGNSGVHESTGPPHGTFEQTVDGVDATGVSVVELGFLDLLEDDAGNWHGVVVTREPEAFSPALPTCDPEAGEPPLPAAPPYLCVERLP